MERHLDSGRGSWLGCAGGVIDTAEAHRVTAMQADQLQGLGPKLPRLPVNSALKTTTALGLYQFEVRRWSCHQQSTAKAKDVKALIFLHGFLGDCRDWDPIAAALSLKADCHAISLPGHGSSLAQPVPGGMSNLRGETIPDNG